MIALCVEQTTCGEDWYESVMSVFTKDYEEKNKDRLIKLITMMNSLADSKTRFYLGNFESPPVDVPIDEIWQDFLKVSHLPNHYKYD